MDRQKLGWMFKTDGVEGIPYIQCPYCGRKISGKKVIFADLPLESCPDCGKELHFDNMKEEDLLYISSYYGDEE